MIRQHSYAHLYIPYNRFNAYPSILPACENETGIDIQLKLFMIFQRKNRKANSPYENKYANLSEVAGRKISLWLYKAKYIRHQLAFARNNGGINHFSVYIQTW